MDRQVKISVQRWEPMDRGRAKIKIAEKNFNITELVHNGEPYVTIKKLGRGRYIVKLKPGYVRPVPTVSETFTPDLPVDIAPETPDRAPMVYAGEIMP